MRLWIVGVVFALGAMLVLGAVACGDDDDDDDDDDDSVDDDTSDDDDDTVEGVPYTISFSGVVGDEAFSCSTEYSGLGTVDAPVNFKDFRVFVSNIKLITAADTEADLTLDQDNPFQTDNLVMLDFEDATGGCDNGTAQTNYTAVGTAPEDDYVGISFDVGVPFELNHAAVESAASPLNVPAMYWSWQGGYKFIRVDAVVGDEVTIPWNIHLGSTACVSDDAGTAPDEECGKPNRPHIVLDGFDPETNTIVIDVAEIVADSDMTTNAVDSAPGCQSFPGDTDCDTLFPNLGLSYDTGACVNDCMDQSFISVE
ncbi:MAG: metallo-mystery pair system four-Cys motif protein [Deltaproteobacteria bacterium]|nr:metallo-mystery pair system four-Cys motif protein [Deltaproteobacteria bacterium]MCB9479495.1 metallo-mystery pair system four-Cys motif protein [Deltaproteobacteria bacterium]MCB9489621.1 metallo-mystery pair system four-Cys motif protein [Deltaproteobacteria bacterium]